MSKATKYYGEALCIYEGTFAPALKKCCSQFELVGGMRRRLSAVEELEVVAIPRPERLSEAMRLGQTWGRSSKSFTGGIQMVNPGGFKARIYWARPGNYGLLVARLTGSPFYWQNMAQALRAKGMTVTDDRLLGADGAEVFVPTEQMLFDLAWVPFVDPPQRS